MYKVVFEFDHDEVEIVQVLEKQGEDWALLKDETLLEKIENKFLSNKSNNPSSKGYGQVVYSPNLNYITGGFEIIK
jgi:hypothetical protein